VRLHPGAGDVEDVAGLGEGIVEGDVAQAPQQILAGEVVDLVRLVAGGLEVKLGVALKGEVLARLHVAGPLPSIEEGGPLLADAVEATGSNEFRLVLADAFHRIRGERKRGPTAFDVEVLQLLHERGCLGEGFLGVATPALHALVVPGAPPYCGVAQAEEGNNYY